MPDITLDGEISTLRSNFINGVKHMPVQLAGNLLSQPPGKWPPGTKQARKPERAASHQPETL